MTEDLHFRLTDRHLVTRDKRWDKILRSMWTPGRYVLPSVALALTGCIASPNVVSVSPDGRYIVVPMNQSGVTSHLGQPSRLVVIDTQTSKVEPLGDSVQGGVYWVDVAAGVTVRGVLPVGKDDAPAVIITQDGKTTTIRDAMFPTLSDDGQQLVYVGRPDTAQLYGRIMRYDVRTGKSHDLEIEGAMPDVSPDGNHVLCVTKADNKWHATVAAMDGSGLRRIAEIDSDAAKNVFPRWIDNDSFLFRTASGETGADSELFIANLMGRIERVTDNDMVDVFPQSAGRNRVLYLSMPKEAGIGNEQMSVAELWMSERRDGKWEDRKLGIRAYSFRVIGDEVLYLVPKSQHTCELLRASLGSPQKSTNVSDWIKANVKELPAPM